MATISQLSQCAWTQNASFRKLGSPGIPVPEEHCAILATRHNVAIGGDVALGPDHQRKSHYYIWDAFPEHFFYADPDPNRGLDQALKLSTVQML